MKIGKRMFKNDQGVIGEQRIRNNDGVLEVNVGDRKTDFKSYVKDQYKSMRLVRSIGLRKKRLKDHQN